jgi:hypothetical protein
MNARMIARAWMDEAYRAELVANGIEVPPRPTDLIDDQLDVLANRQDGELLNSAMPCTCS